MVAILSKRRVNSINDADKYRTLWCNSQLYGILPNLLDIVMGCPTLQDAKPKEEEDEPKGYLKEGED